MQNQLELLCCMTNKKHPDKNGNIHVVRFESTQETFTEAKTDSTGFILLINRNFLTESHWLCPRKIKCEGFQDSYVEK